MGRSETAALGEATEEVGGYPGVRGWDGRQRQVVVYVIGLAHADHGARDVLGMVRTS